jgi:hypothetical protein
MPTNSTKKRHPIWLHQNTSFWYWLGLIAWKIFPNAVINKKNCNSAIEALYQLAFADTYLISVVSNNLVISLLLVKLINWFLAKIWSTFGSSIELRPITISMQVYAI